jgi:hypothetical protein
MLPRVCALDVLSIRQGDDKRTIGWTFVETCRITEDVMAGRARVENGWFLCCVWWGTSERFNDFFIYFINHCFLTRPYTSDIWLSDLAFHPYYCYG